MLGQSDSSQEQTELVDFDGTEETFLTSRLVPAAELARRTKVGAVFLSLFSRLTSFCDVQLLKGNEAVERYRRDANARRSQGRDLSSMSEGYQNWSYEFYTPSCCNNPTDTPPPSSLQVTHPHWLHPAGRERLGRALLHFPSSI